MTIPNLTQPGIFYEQIMPFVLGNLNLTGGLSL